MSTSSLSDCQSESDLDSIQNSCDVSIQKNKHKSAETSKIDVRAPEFSVYIPKIRVIASGTLSSIQDVVPGL